MSSRIASSCSNVLAGCLRVPGISTGWISAANRRESSRNVDQSTIAAGVRWDFSTTAAQLDLASPALTKP